MWVDRLLNHFDAHTAAYAACIFAITTAGFAALTIKFVRERRIWSKMLSWVNASDQPILFRFYLGIWLIMIVIGCLVSGYFAWLALTE